MSANRQGRAPPGWTSPEALSGVVNARKYGIRAGSVLATAVVIALALAPGFALGSMYEAINGDRETLPRRPIHRFDRADTFGRAQEARDAAELFQRQCVACHGKKGKGDGPAAPAMTPRPADLTDPEQIGELSDEQLIEVLTKGKGAMPSFGALLGPEEIRAMARYVRELSGTEDDP